MAEQFSVDVLICGAGAAGLTLAIDLARRGISFRLVEKMAVPFGGSRGKGIQPRTQEIFQDLGILERIVAAGDAYPPLRKYLDDGSFAESDIMERKDPTPAEPYKQPLMLPQFMTEGMMRQRLEELGHRPEFDRELTGFEQDSQGVTVHLSGCAGKEAFRVRWLVGADGGRSFVRHALGIDFPGKSLGMQALVADTQLTGLTRDVWHCFNQSDKARMLMICPLAGTEMFQIQAPATLDEEPDLSAEGLTAMVADRTGRSDIKIQSVSWASAYKMNARLAESYRSERVFLIGDAAHIHPPTGGQGLNTSVQDAYNLGWKLAAAAQGAPDELLDTYNEERRPVAAVMLGLATQLLDAQKQGEMRRGREVQQLDIGYPESSLSLETLGHERILHAGDRAPDAPVSTPAGQPIRLFDLFKGSHWTLLTYQCDAAALKQPAGLHVYRFSAEGDLNDNAGHFLDAYGLTAGEWILVRPDGYIGAIVTSKDVERLENYFLQVGLSW
ncbi:FAD-binding protein [Rouxiella sp. S1S-2]|uniref:FAD-dependent oxidoreductase n=1 Tax=Rouxiella sp. S1S-2 TaxID=2653856 RepID=UPI0012647954|nr:FAD-dependent oxidoreductase [Rouxiella sp. S1S-2]KAB7896498.1 FAD-binding protein [Rouxiella sp. S1S-2]